MQKKYNIGDRIFYRSYNGSIDSAIVIGLEETYYRHDGEIVRFDWLKTGKYFGIEDYNCLDPDSDECREVAKKYAEYDINKDMILNKIQVILDSYDEDIRKEIIKEINIRFGDYDCY